MKRITIFSGHYGSGKTNVAINYAKMLKQKGFEVCIADLDIVNPYFRTKDSEKALAENGIELIVLAGFMSILSADFTSKFPKRIINVHPSLIPSFCGKGFYGLRVHEAALEYGVKVTGATVHYVNEVPDGGEIILQKSVSIKKNETPESLQQKVMRQAEWIILPKAVELVSANIATERKEK